jgi:hypothetical protein
MKKIAFTIVLNGMPYIKQQYEVIPKVFDEWYIIEGATRPVYDTGWCSNISKKFYSDKFTSIDGTSEFLDSIASDKIKIIRKNDFWDGKVEMCNSFMNQIENCSLMQIDVDEVWDIETLNDILNYSESNDYFDGMLFKCNYYVGSDLITIGENCYGNNPNEWCRFWKIKNKTFWVSHEPPRIRGCTKFLTRDYTKSKNWTFNHYAYALQSQLEFKENFYNYKGAVEQWKKLQENTVFPCKLKNFLPWVDDKVEVIRIKNK